MKLAKWKQVHGYVTPGGDPVYACSNCGGSEHVYGIEHPKRKLVCDKCGCVMCYPWEKTYEEVSECE